MKAAASGLLILAAALLAACAGKVEVDAPEFAIHVVDPGNLPGRVVAYTFPNGAWPRFYVGVDVHTTWSAGDRQDVPAPLPHGRFPISIETRPSPDGSAVATLHIGKPVPGIPGCPELAGEMTFEASGRVRSSTLAVPADAPPAVRPVLDALLGRLSRLLIPLPETNIGEGARWRVARPLGGAEEIVSCRLARLHVDEARITSTLVRQAKGLPATVALHARHGDVEAVYRAGSATGQATLEIDLRTFYLGGEETITATKDYEVVGDGGGAHQVVRTRVRARTSIAP